MQTAMKTTSQNNHQHDGLPRKPSVHGVYGQNHWAKMMSVAMIHLLVLLAPMLIIGHLLKYVMALFDEQIWLTAWMPALTVLIGVLVYLGLLMRVYFKHGMKSLRTMLMDARWVVTSEGVHSLLMPSTKRYPWGDLKALSRQGHYIALSFENKSIRLLSNDDRLVQFIETHSKKALSVKRARLEQMNWYEDHAHYKSHPGSELTVSTVADTLCSDRKLYAVFLTVFPALLIAYIVGMLVNPYKENEYLVIGLLLGLGVLLIIVFYLINDLNKGATVLRLDPKGVRGKRGDLLVFQGDWADIEFKRYRIIGIKVIDRQYPRQCLPLLQISHPFRRAIVFPIHPEKMDQYMVMLEKGKSLAVERASIKERGEHDD